MSIARLLALALCGAPSAADPRVSRDDSALLQKLESDDIDVRRAREDTVEVGFANDVTPDQRIQEIPGFDSVKEYLPDVRYEQVAPLVELLPQLSAVLARELPSILETANALSEGTRRDKRSLLVGLRTGEEFEKRFKRMKDNYASKYAQLSSQIHDLSKELVPLGSAAAKLAPGVVPTDISMQMYRFLKDRLNATALKALDLALTKPGSRSDVLALEASNVVASLTGMQPCNGGVLDTIASLPGAPSDAFKRVAEIKRGFAELLKSLQEATSHVASGAEEGTRALSLGHKDPGAPRQESHNTPPQGAATVAPAGEAEVLGPGKRAGGVVFRAPWGVYVDAKPIDSASTTPVPEDYAGAPRGCGRPNVWFLAVALTATAAAAQLRRS